MDGVTTGRFDPQSTRRVDTATGDITGDMLAIDEWSDDMLQVAGIPIVDVPFVTVGGGLGSFALVDFLRIGGVPVDDIAVLTNLDRPWETYAYLAANSQIPNAERLRSDSGSVMDNIWGFPSYAVREAFAPGRDGFLKPLWNVLTEPIAADYYTPQAGQVYDSVDRETARIQWSAMLRKGRVRVVRKRRDGGYFSLLTPPQGTTPTKRVAYRSHHVHIAVGYPGVKFLPDLQAYRTEHQDFGRVVNAYEPHDHVYEQLLARPSTVIVRGSGIVASRVLQRLADDIEIRGAETKIRHLFRNYVDGPQGASVFFRRPGANGWAYQAFNFPKAAWGGQFRDKLLAMDREDRPAWIRGTGGTNTAPRKSWKSTYIGTVDEVVPGDGGIVTRIQAKDGALVEIESDYIVDATGLEADIREHRLLADLLDHVGAGTNPLGRLDASPEFTVYGTDSGSGRMYASGSITLGSYYSPVDSFLGLQYAALQIADDLAERGLGNKIRTIRGIRHWWRWMRNRQI
jgi:pSer/pThr/pTyr-binding forkhead associated (FHA) protein